MAKGVMMPKQGITVESCILTKWNVKVGDAVKKGDVLFSYKLKAHILVCQVCKEFIINTKKDTLL